MSAEALRTLSVSTRGGDSSTLLSVVSMLHRRGVEVTDFAWSTTGPDSREALVTFRGCHQKARTVEASLRNLVCVTDVAPSVVGSGEVRVDQS